MPSSATAEIDKPKAKPRAKPPAIASGDELRPAFITLPIVIAVHRDRDRGRYYAAYATALRDPRADYERAVRLPDHRQRDFEFFTIDMRVRPEAVTGVSHDDGPDGAIVLINGVQYTCRMSPKAIYEMLL